MHTRARAVPGSTRCPWGFNQGKRNITEQRQLIKADVDEERQIGITAYTNAFADEDKVQPATRRGDGLMSVPQGFYSGQGSGCISDRNEDDQRQRPTGRTQVRARSSSAAPQPIRCTCKATFYLSQVSRTGNE